jgi:hypothetical protein
MTIDLVVKILSALLTPLIALIAAYIAWQQWKTNERKLKLDLYDRRYEVYEATRSFILTICKDAGVQFEEIGHFRATVAQARFLFGKDITDYLELLRSRAFELQSWNGKYLDSYQPKPDDYDHNLVVENMHRELEWLVEQLEPAAEKFGRYLWID